MPWFRVLWDDHQAQATRGACTTRSEDEGLASPRDVETLISPATDRDSQFYQLLKILPPQKKFKNSMFFLIRAI